MLHICLWLWKGERKAWGSYRASHLNRVAAMVRANLSLPNEIVAITDMPDGIDPSIRIVPLWPDLAEQGRCFRRLKLFDPETARSIGDRIAWIDLDVVVLGDLTPLFMRTEPLVLWRSQTTRAAYNGSILLMTADAHPEVWTGYRPGMELSGVGSDQNVIEHILGAKMPVWTEVDGVFAYNRYGRRWRRGPPPGARLLAFPGTVKPNSHICQKLTPWVQTTLDSYGAVEDEQYRWFPRGHAGRAAVRFARRKARLERQGVHSRI